MNPSDFRISAMRTFSREAGTSTFSCSARLALRTRVSRSAMGSLLIGASPARLDHARHLTPEGVLAEAEAAQAELPEVPARPAAEPAAVVGPCRELRRALGFHDQCGLGHARATP